MVWFLGVWLSAVIIAFELDILGCVFMVTAPGWFIGMTKDLAKDYKQTGDQNVVNTKGSERP